jgi:hypothetical protein
MSYGFVAIKKEAVGGVVAGLRVKLRFEAVYGPCRVLALSRIARAAGNVSAARLDRWFDLVAGGAAASRLKWCRLRYGRSASW